MTKPWSQMSIKEQIASMTGAQLKAAIEKGKSQLLLIDALEASEDFEHGTERHASKKYEQWSGADYSNRRRMLNVAIHDCEHELAHRIALSQQPNSK